MNFSRRNIMTLLGAVALAGVLIAAGLYGPSAWRVITGADEPGNQVITQVPPVDQAAGTDDAMPLVVDPSTAGVSENTNEGVAGAKKYVEPDLAKMNLAPSLEGFFGDSALSTSAKSLAFGAAWNIHQYVDGYLYGVTAGPQMNEADIRRYIIFHKALWDNQMEKEQNVKQAATFNTYFANLLNRGIDAFDAKDPVRIDQFHQELHDLDMHLLRDDMSARVYGATPFPTKRSE
ncbi:MAG: hypothetical protein LBB49_04020 [Gracilibacteraceae bacterium]|nr:hypothetical protein [Gracilibacteraceae bacterium]